MKDRFIKHLRKHYKPNPIGSIGHDSDFETRVNEQFCATEALQGGLAVSFTDIELSLTEEEAEDGESGKVVAECKLDAILLAFAGDFFPEPEDEDEEVDEEFWMGEWEEMVKSTIDETLGWKVGNIENTGRAVMNGFPLYRLALDPPQKFVLAEMEWKSVNGFPTYEEH